MSTSVCWVDMGEGNTLLDEQLEAASGFFIAIKLMALNVDKMNGRVMQKKLLFILPSSLFLVKEWGPCHFFKSNSTII